MIVTPIVKWAGGKTAIREVITSYFPRDFNNYIEPFCGSAAIALSLDNSRVTINDLNQELINVYYCLRDEEFENVCDYLRIWQDCCDYLSEKFYYTLRDDFNMMIPWSKNPAKKAALFIALNKLGFNGLYRENSKGEFNVPWGKRGKNTKIYDRDKLEAIHKRLQTFWIYCKDYSELEYLSNDFVYFDPPYDIISNNFTSYNKTAFDRKEQKRLAEFCKSLTIKKVQFCLSNADTLYIRELYRNYRIVEIEAPRRIACNGDRTKAKELLIMNYE